MHRFILLRSLLPVIALTAACSDDAPPVDPFPISRTDLDAVHVQGRAFRDGRGRQLLFRGYNVKVPGIFDVTFDDGRRPNYEIVPLREDDGARIEQLGHNVVRLPINWSALEPQPQQYSESFLNQVEEFLGLAQRHNFYVLIDMHQDAYSKEIGEDGAPLWAIVPPPEALLEGPSNDERRLSGPVMDAGFSFFNNAPATDGRPLQEAFTAAVQVVVRRFAGNPRVLGFEAFNEPVLLDTELLDAFHHRFADGVHAIDRDAPVLFEPLGVRNQFDRAVVPAEPWQHGPGAYAPHIYTGWFSIPSQNGWESEDPALLSGSMEAAEKEAAAWNTPLFITEFGCDQSIERGPRWLEEELNLQDRLLASSTAWVWREAGTWGLSDNQYVQRPSTAKVMARTFPRAVAGDLLAIERPEPGTMRVRWRQTQRTIGLAHEVSVSADYLQSYEILCDGAPVPFQAHDGWATFSCAEGAGERTFEVVGVLAP